MDEEMAELDVPSRDVVRRVVPRPPSPQLQHETNFGADVEPATRADELVGVEEEGEAESGEEEDAGAGARNVCAVESSAWRTLEEVRDDRQP